MGGGRVQARGLHLDREHAHALPSLVEGRVRVVERVRGEDVAHVDRHVCLAGAVHDVLDEAEGADRGVGAGDLILIEERRVRARSLGNHDVVQVDVWLQGTARAHTHEARAAELVNQLVGVQRDRGDAHARSHNGYRGAAVGAGVAQHVAHGVELLGVLQVGLGDELRAQRVSGQEDRRRDGGGGVDVRCRAHVSSCGVEEPGAPSRLLYPCRKAMPCN